MCHDTERFVDQEKASKFKCPICQLVFCCPQVNGSESVSKQEPKRFKNGGHIYCECCIKKWLRIKQSCPTCKEDLEYEYLTDLNESTYNDLRNLRIRCKYENRGCKKIVRLELIESHELNCSFKSMFCNMCGTDISNEDSHDQSECIDTLVEIVRSKNNEIERQKQAIIKLKKKENELTYELQTQGRNIVESQKKLDEFNKIMRESEELARICNSSDNNINRVKKLVNLSNVIVNYEDKRGYTPLINASRMGYLDIVDYLIKNGADVNYKATNDYTALIMASECGRSNVVQLLIQKGANVNAKKTDGQTALIGASGEGYSDIVKLLVENGAKVNSKTNVGFTALMSASYFGHTSIVKYLVANEASINIKDKSGKTALSYARNNEIEKYLK